MPTVITKGAKTAQGYGFAAQAAAAVTYPYIEDVFSTYLYTATGSAQTITNGIDLAGKGGMVWVADRTVASASHHNLVTDTERGRASVITTNTTDQAFSSIAGRDFVSFNSDGFSVGTPYNFNYVYSSSNYVSWTFRKQAKFFDVVTYTGTGSNTTIAHALGSVPGCIIVKRTDTTSDWQVYHSGLTSAAYSIQLNLTNAQASAPTIWNSTTPTSSVFSVGTDATVNASGGTYVAYLFASNAGGFGSAGTDNVITCGSFTTNGSGNATVNLGYEPQYVMFKRTDGVGDWYTVDTMRGFTNDPTVSNQAFLYPNKSNAESIGSGIGVLSTGFNLAWFASQSYIYIAIRRGPMKTPTTGTSVFEPATRTGTGAITTVTTSISPVDMMWVADRSGTLGGGPNDFDRLRGANRLLVTSTAAAEVTTTDTLTSFAVQNGYTLGADAGGYAVNYSGYSFINWNFKRAPGFFDEVCYTGTGTYPFTINHNLGVVPELMIFKTRSTTGYWYTYAKPLTSPNANWYQNYMSLNVTTASNSDTTSFTTAPTSTTITAASYFAASGTTYVAYLFATVAGVSKVGTYTGNGTTQTINCGFGAGGVRFVLIKRTDSTGGWYVYDTARGMTTLTDPYLFLNSTAAEVATLGSVTTVSTGFALNSAILAAINVSGGSYIFLAIA